jgi:hypothetical protein
MLIALLVFPCALQIETLRGVPFYPDKLTNNEKLDELLKMLILYIIGLNGIFLAMVYFFAARG